MYLTVGEVLALPPLRELSLVAGSSGLERQVTRVSVLEVPPGSRRWTRGGELFMSSLYAFRDQGADTYVDAIDLLHYGEAAALCLHPGLTGFRFLDLMARRAEELGIPLILLPQDMPYCVVTDAVMGGLLGRQSALLERSAAINRELTQVILTGGGLDGICRIVARRMQRHVAILENGSNEVLSHSGTTSRERELLVDLVESRFSLDDARPVPLPTVLSSGGPRQIYASTHETQHGPVSVLAAPVVVGDETAARLVIWGSDEPCSELDLMILAHACTVVGLEVLKRRAVLEAERRIQQDFYGAALSGDFATHDAAARQARQAGVTLAPGYLVGVFDWSGQFIQQQIRILGNWSGSAAVVARDVLAVVLPVSTRRQRPFADAGRLMSEIADHLADEYGLPHNAGLSRLADDILGLPAALAEAKLALSVAGTLNYEQGPLAFADLGILQLLAGMEDSAWLRQFVSDTLRPLLLVRDGPDLMRTLEAYLDAGGGYLAAAKAVEVHPNTVKYRVEKIRTLLGSQSLTDPVRRLGLHVALKGYRLLNVQNCVVEQEFRVDEGLSAIDLSAEDKMIPPILCGASIAAPTNDGQY
jgi:purine catabolism regulator